MNRTRIMQLATAAISALLAGCATHPPVQTARHVDLERYAGRWYEIARFPVFFERGLVGVTAQYALESDGRVRVTNQGFKGAFDGEIASITGYAKVVDPATNAKLRVRFDPFPVRFFPAPYWVVEVGDDYEYAVVTNPKRKVLWILGRAPTMDEDTYQAIVARLDAQGFATERLERTLQQ
ncbi:MAG: lipocalin family protein [Candidatus Hydrogenedentes bacterium]|nr:lipocalin family protein [Candidatus Hydrogenedentota bacterium]